MTAAYPWSLLRPEDSALCLFVAAFAGSQDLQHVRDAGLRRVTACDIDTKKLAAMEPHFPDEWLFANCDGFALLEKAARTIGTDMQPDIVTSDPWSGDHELKVVDVIGDLVKLAKRVLIFGCSEIGREKALVEFAVHGQEPMTVKRSDLHGGVYWLVCVKP